MASLRLLRKRHRSDKIGDLCLCVLVGVMYEAVLFQPRPRQNYKYQELGELAGLLFVAFLISCVFPYLLCTHALVKWTLDYLVVST